MSFGVQLALLGALAVVIIALGVRLLLPLMQRNPEKRERKASYMREWRMRHLDEIRVREKEWRAKRQAISLSGNQPATSPDAAPLSPVGS